MKKPANMGLAASVHQRLLNVARETGRPFNEVLQYFAMERLLYRLSCSPHADSFVLKGALLFRVWNVPDSRATRDIDFLAFLDNTPAGLASIVREVCALDDADGLLFDPDSVTAQKIKEDADYEGVLVRLRVDNRATWLLAKYEDDEQNGYPVASRISGKPGPA